MLAGRKGSGKPATWRGQASGTTAQLGSFNAHRLEDIFLGSILLVSLLHAFLVPKLPCLGLQGPSRNLDPYSSALTQRKDSITQMRVPLSGQAPG